MVYCRFDSGMIKEPLPVCILILVLPLFMGFTIFSASKPYKAHLIGGDSGTKEMNVYAPGNMLLSSYNFQLSEIIYCLCPLVLSQKDAILSDYISSVTVEFFYSSLLKHLFV